MTVSNSSNNANQISTEGRGSAGYSHGFKNRSSLRMASALTNIKKAVIIVYIDMMLAILE
jgi:hypothetical protein